MPSTILTGISKHLRCLQGPHANLPGQCNPSQPPVTRNPKRKLDSERNALNHESNLRPLICCELKGCVRYLQHATCSCSAHAGLGYTRVYGQDRTRHTRTDISHTHEHTQPASARRISVAGGVGSEELDKRCSIQRWLSLLWTRGGDSCPGSVLLVTIHSFEMVIGGHRPVVGLVDNTGQPNGSVTAGVTTKG